MAGQFVVVEAARDRQAIGRAVVMTAAIALIYGLPLVAHVWRDTFVTETASANGARHHLVLHGDGYGQCHVAARINGSAFRRLLVDSGASGHLVFGRNHARRLGFDPASLTYSYSYSSANGIGHEAQVQVREFRLDSFVMHDVAADVTEKDQPEPLLGISILRRLNLQLKDGNCELSWS